MTAEANRFRLRKLLEGDQIVIAPGAYDALSARVIEDAGFETVYVTGAGFANASFGFPDVGLVSAAELFTHAARICAAVDVPVIVDADTGYGGVLQVRRTVAELERAGAAGLQLEDQVTSKRCGHFDGQELVSLAEMRQKVRAAVDARTDPNLIIIARTDARNVEGFDAAVKRANAYVEAGADAIFVEAPKTRDEVIRLPQLIDAPLITNMVEGGKTPLLTAAELQAAGYSVVLFANTALRASISAVQEVLAVLKADGGSAGLTSRIASWNERQRLVHLSEYQAIDEAYSSEGSPQAR